MVEKKLESRIYTCPMHPEVTDEMPGSCPKCGMDLVKVGILQPVSAAQNPYGKKKNLKTLLPLIIIFGLLSLASLVQVFIIRKTENDIDPLRTSIALKEAVRIFMSSFMGGFFLVFGGFKLLDVKGFAHGFQTYDILEKRVPSYGLVYPFIELGLGFLFLLQEVTMLATLIALVISSVGMIGVGIKLRKKEVIQCVCLGTIFDLPLTNVTLFENLLMAAMAIGMLTF